jgi:low temperature requirement protein LtrA
MSEPAQGPQAQAAPAAGSGGSGTRGGVSLLRNHGGGHAPVSYLELFFDLVYVFAITQLSHTMLAHMGLLGLVETTMLFLAVWWVWIFTTWAANWTDPERAPVRSCCCWPCWRAWGCRSRCPKPSRKGRTGTRCCSRAAMSACRWGAVPLSPGRWRAVGGPMTVAGATTRLPSTGRSRRAQHAADHRVVFRLGPLLAGGRTGGRSLWHLLLWALALAIDFGGPLCGFATPGLGRSLPEDWTISGSHMAERCALFIIIALGEGIVVSGSSLAHGEPGAVDAVAMILAFAGSALMWWIYFGLGAERGARRISGNAQAGRMARQSYTYLHMPIVGGIVISAVADALLLPAPLAPATMPLIATQIGGLLVFLIGTGLFKKPGSPHGNFPLSHWIGGVLLVAIAAWGALAHPPAALLVGASVVALTVVAWREWASLHDRAPV